MADNKTLPLEDGDLVSGAPPSNTTSRVGSAPTSSKFLPLSPSDILGGSSPAGKIKVNPEWDTEFKKRMGETTKKDVGEVIGPALPIVGGLGGSLFGPGGSAVGTGLGSGIQSYLMGDSPTDIAESSLVGAGTSYAGGKLLSPIQNRLTAALAATLLNRGVQRVQGREFGPPAEEATDLGKDLGLNFGLNIIGSKISNALQNRGASPSQPLEQEVNQQRQNIITPGPVSEQGTPSQSKSQYGAQAQDAIRGNLAKATNVEKVAFDNFRKGHVEPNTQKLTKLVGYETSKFIDPTTGQPTVTPKTEEVEIKGPIFTVNTQALAQKVMPELDGFMKGETYQQLPPAQQAKYSKLYATIKDLATPFTAFQNGQEVEVPVKEWETVKEVRTDINRLISGKPTPTFPEAGLKLVADALGKDTDFSISKLWTNGTQAANALNVANRATQFKKEVFNKEIKDRLYGKYDSGKTDIRTPADPSETFNAAFKSPEKAQRLMTALGPENAGYIKGNYFDNVLMENSFGQNYSKFNPDSIITELENPNSVSRVILNSEERNNLLQFARAARAMGENTDRSALSISGDRAFLHLSYAASRAITGSSTPARIVLGTKNLLDAAKDEKVVSGLASRLIKVRPDSPEGQIASKNFIRALRGAEVVVNLNGQDYKSRIDENGKIKPIGSGL